MSEMRRKLLGSYGRRQIQTETGCRLRLYTLVCSTLEEAAVAQSYTLMTRVQYMGSSLVTISTFIGAVLSMHCFNVELALGFDACPDFSCGNQDIRFPFRIIGHQPQQCGYPGFDLVCSANNETLLQLPKSVTFTVKNIDYKEQTIELSDAYGCLSRQLHNLTLSASPFHFIIDFDNLDNYDFFNCSPADRGNMDYRYVIPCLSSSTSQVYALSSAFTIDDMPISFCTKMFNISSIPEVFVREDNILRLRWSEPNCRHCESIGNRCGWKNNNSTKKDLYCSVNNKGSSKALLTTGSVLGSFFLVLVTGAVFYIYNSYIIKKEKQAIIEKFLEDYRALKPTRYSYAQIKRITNNFKDKLGEGAYGTVFKGGISKEVTVAVKMLNNSQGNGEEFINEVGIIGRIHHVNIVRLVGFCADGIRRALIYEFLPNCSLQKFVNSPDNKQNFLGWKKLHEIALGIAKGIEYLHQGCDQRILHFDIKPQNVLLDHNFTPKISDFGLAKLCSKDQSMVSMTTARGTLGYIAPEVFSRNFGKVSYKSDIYSYGMMLLETIGGKKITEDIEENNSHIYYPEWIYNLLEEREEMRIHIDDQEDAKIVKKLAIVGLWCIQWHPVDRPSMHMVIQMLEGDLDKLPIPPNPFVSAGPTRSHQARIGVSTRQVTQNLEVIQE